MSKIGENNMTEVTLPESISAVAKCATQPEDVYSENRRERDLCGVHVHYDGGHLVAHATEGRMILRVTYPTAAESLPSVTIPIEALRAFGGSPGRCEIGEEGEEVVVRKGGREVRSPKDSKGFPDTNRPFARHKSKSHIIVNLDYLLTILNAMKSLAGVRRDELPIGEDDEPPILLVRLGIEDCEKTLHISLAESGADERPEYNSAEALLMPVSKSDTGFREEEATILPVER